jgi:hypothetical protein
MTSTPTVESSICFQAFKVNALLFCSQERRA